MLILVINSGSSSLKFQLIDSEKKQMLAKGLCERIGIEEPFFDYENGGCSIHEPRQMDTHKDAVHILLETLIDPECGVIRSLDEIAAVGHRVVHGGPHFSQPALVSEESKEA
ncbi:MAG: acetate kinase, partial [Clostridiaceae bacterium]|nr:acetate kinase [Clostridiaceae bacterium]